MSLVLSQSELKLIIFALEERGDKKANQFGDDSTQANEYYDLANKIREKRGTIIGKLIEINPQLEEDICYFCKDELDWHISECKADEYDIEINAQIELLRLLGRDDAANTYKNAYEEWKKNNQ